MGKILICFVLVAAFLMSETLAATPCAAYQCATSPLNEDNFIYGVNRICATKLMVNYNPVVYLDQCQPEDYTCNHAATLQQDKTAYCTAPWNPNMITGLYPGEFCTTSANCKSQNCTNNVCVGLPFDANCTEDVECDVGLYCNNLGAGYTDRCVDVLDVGHACSQSLKCGFGLVCVNDMCVKALSLPLGANVTDSVNGWLACQSLTTTLGQDGHLLTCSNPPKLVSTVQQTQVNVQCKYQAAGSAAPLFQTIPSQCYFSQHGMALCPLGIGDVQDKFQVLINSYFSQNMTFLCNRAQHLYLPCNAAIKALNLTSQVEGYLIALSGNEDPFPYVINTAYIEDNSECAKQTVTSFYWNLVGANSNPLITLGAALLVAVLSWAF